MAQRCQPRHCMSVHVSPLCTRTPTLISKSVPKPAGDKDRLILPTLECFAQSSYLVNPLSLGVGKVV